MTNFKENFKKNFSISKKTLS